jgi:hypothetical protein
MPSPTFAHSSAQTGATAIWFMKGLRVSSIASLGTVPTTWTIQGLNAD